MFCLVAAGALSACDTAVPPPPTAIPFTTPSPVVPLAATGTETNMQDAVTVAGVRAHLLAADSLSSAGQKAAALKHIEIIQGELVPALQGSAAAKPLAGGLTEAVGLYAGLLEGGMQTDATALTAAHTAALTAADTGVIALGGSALDTSAGRAELVHDLLAKVESEYAESLQGGPVDHEPYETAFGYFQVASEQYRDLQGIVRATQPGIQPDLDEQFEQLALAFPSITDPATPPVAPSDVESHVDTINATLATFTGATPATGFATVIADTRTAVATALTQYAAGQTDAAYETAAGAYLNHFEGLEGPLGKKDAALVGTLEGQFKDLRDGIKANKAAADLQAIAGQINTGLDKAQQLLSGSN